MAVQTADSRQRYIDRTEVSSCIKYTLFFSNFILFISGAVALSLGIWIQTSKKKVMEYLVDFILDPSIMLMCLGGSVTFFVSFFGCCGSLRENTVLLTIYHWCLTILLLFEVALVVFVFIFHFSPETLRSLNIFPEAAFRDAIVKYRDDPDMQDLIDGMQEMLECCGVSNSQDGYMDWNANMYFNCSNANPSHERCGVPHSCCIIEPGDAINFLCGKGVMEEKREDVVKRIHPHGCLYALSQWIDRNAIIAGGVTIGIFIPQIVVICFAKQLKDQIKAQVAKWRM